MCVSHIYASKKDVAGDFHINFSLAAGVKFMYVNSFLIKGNILGKQKDTGRKHQSLWVNQTC